MKTFPTVVLALGLSLAACTPRPAGAPLGGVAGLAVAATGRNLLTLTSYRGLDPEVGRAATWAGGAAVTGRAGFAYPHFPELSLAVEIGF